MPERRPLILNLGIRPSCQRYHPVALPPLVPVHLDASNRRPAGKRSHFPFIHPSPSLDTILTELRHGIICLLLYFYASDGAGMAQSVLLLVIGWTTESLEFESR
jgi:hypothetical protein